MASLRERPLKSGDGRWAVVVVEDTFGQAEVLVFSKAYEEAEEKLKSGEPILIKGRVLIDDIDDDGQQLTPKMRAGRRSVGPGGRVVFRGRLYRFEYVRKDYKPNTTGDSYFRFIDVETGSYQVTATSMGTLGLLNELHRGQDAARSWSWVIDVSGDGRSNNGPPPAPENTPVPMTTFRDPPNGITLEYPRSWKKVTPGSPSPPAISTVWVRGVATPPGQTKLTPIRCWRRSKRSTSETPRSPNLLAEYAACQGMPMIPAAEDTLTR